MAHTLCFSGMDRAEEAKLKLLFADANEWLGGNWKLVPENDAEVLVIDLESMYGHMTWLKVHNSNRRVIALSSRVESEAEHLLLRPVTVESLVTALSEASGLSIPRKPAVSAGDAMALSKSAGASAPQAVPRPDPPAPLVDAAPSRPPAPAAPVTTATPAPARAPGLWDYLQPGKLPGPSKLEISGAPPLVIDPTSDSYFGGVALKPYIPYCELGSVRAEQWLPVSADEIKRLGGESGGAQPLARLRWMYALVQGQGQLAPGYDPADKYRLTRWPKTEREYPRHFRIATVMMQGPATLAEIATQSGTTLEEVNDFVNASLDSGFAEPLMQPSAPDTPAKSGGLLGRLRGR